VSTYKLVEAEDGTLWPPVDERAGEIEWRLRHAPILVTDSDRMVAASLIAALRELVVCPAKKRELVIRALKEAGRA
jgi:hypothetical protein